MEFYAAFFDLVTIDRFVHVGQPVFRCVPKDMQSAYQSASAVQDAYVIHSAPLSKKLLKPIQKIIKTSMQTDLRISIGQVGHGAGYSR